MPSGVPVAELLGGLAAALPDRPPAGRVALARGGGAPLPPEATLADGGVSDGEVLTLDADGWQPRPHLPGPRRPWTGRQRRGCQRKGCSVPASPGRSPRSATGMPPDHGRHRGTARLPRPCRHAAGSGCSAGARQAWRASSHERWLEAAVAAPVPARCACVGVVGATPRAGATTVAALLAAVLAAGRAGRTVAVDANPGPGSLTELLVPGHDLDAGDLLGLLGHPDLTGPELGVVLARRGALAVLAAAAPLDERAWTEVVGVLRRHATTVVVDCGLGMAAAGTRAAVAAADQFVLVTDPASPAATLLAADLLAEGGRPPVVVVNRAGGQFDAGAVVERVPSARGAVLLPDDAAAARALPAGPAPAGAAFDWSRLPGLWRRQALELAVLLLADWPLLGLADVPDRRAGSGAGEGQA